MKQILSFLLMLVWLPLLGQHTVEIIGAGSSWKYWDMGFSVPDSTRWKTDTLYNVSAWGTGNAPLGYGDPVSTTIGYGGDPMNKHRTAYFRKEVTLTGYLDGGDTTVSRTCAAYKLRVKRDDGIVVYINGRIVFRDNLPLPFGFHTYAPLVTEGDTWIEILIDPHIFRLGRNIIAVEVHQNANDSSDLFFDLELKSLSVFPFAQNAIIRQTDSWRYLDNNTDPGSTWKNVGYNDATWSLGVGEFGYGEGDETTIINYGSNPASKYITTYFRKTFNIGTLDDMYKLRIRRDDGIVLYINGVEYFRDNFNSYTNIIKTTMASNAEDDGNVWDEIFIKGTSLVVGSNTIAVEIHQATLNSTDLSFFFELVGIKTTSDFITRGPYLQKSTPNSIKIIWRTATSTIGQVRYGTDPNNLNLLTPTTASMVEHNVSISGLNADTKYYYSIETNSTILERTSDNYFITNPAVGSERKTRIWAMGCFGSGKYPQRQVQERFLEYGRNKHTDLFLQMGDLAYWNANELDFQANYFQPYQNYRVMKQTPIYPSIGNHEYGVVGFDYTNITGLTYYNIFDLFTNAEAGGVASNVERYYSFNYGNIHVISIDPYGKEAGSNLRVYENGSIQRQWLVNDLATNTQKWVIVMVHTPPYSKGKHDSDSEPEMIGVRQNLVPLFEQYNVDLVLSAHSHDYERSKLIKGHYGIESSYNPGTHEVSTSSGKYDGTANSCFYNKQTSTGGIVYAVVGSGGRLETGVQTSWPHDAMAAGYNLSHQGSYLIEVESNRMDISWVSIDGEPNVVKDKFTVMKDLNLSTETVVVPNGTPTVTLTAPWIGNYVWSNGATTRSINVPATNTSYTVTDGSTACLNKIYNITVSTCPSTMTITNAISTGTVKYEASQTIFANNVISGTANVTYDAGKSITLTPGFVANSGTVFKAYIDGCGNLRVSTPK